MELTKEQQSVAQVAAKFGMKSASIAKNMGVFKEDLDAYFKSLSSVAVKPGEGSDMPMPSQQPGSSPEANK